MADISTNLKNVKMSASAFDAAAEDAPLEKKQKNGWCSKHKRLVKTLPCRSILLTIHRKATLNFTKRALDMKLRMANGLGTSVRVESAMEPRCKSDHSSTSF